MEENDYEAARDVYRAAADLIPEPKGDWDASTWIYTAIGDTLYFEQNYPEALTAFQEAVMSPDGLGNGYIHLRLRQCQFELGNLTRAADELTRAYMAKGAEFFDDEPPKYFEFLSTQIPMD